jgi:hypothetical protein
MPQSPVAAYIHKPFYIYVDLFPEIAFDLMILLDNVPDFGDFFVGQRIGPFVRINAGLGKYVIRR